MDLTKSPRAVFRGSPVSFAHQPVPSEIETLLDEMIAGLPSGSISEMLEDENLRDGQARVVNGESFLIDTSSPYTANGDTVLDLDGISGQAISKRTLHDTTAIMLADTRTEEELPEGMLQVARDGVVVETADQAATDDYVENSGGLKVTLARSPFKVDGSDSAGYLRMISNARMGEQVKFMDLLSKADAQAMLAEENTDDQLALLNNVLTDDRFNNLLLAGKLHISGRVSTNGARVMGSDRRRTTIWGTAAASSVRLEGQGSHIGNLTISDDYDADVLFEVGQGTQGGVSNDLTFEDLFIYGGKKRTALIREYANWTGRGFTAKQAGGRTYDTGLSNNGTIQDAGGISLEVRSVGSMYDFAITGATGTSLLFAFYEAGTAWEENRCVFSLGRVHTGYRELLRAVNYDEDEIMDIILSNILWENPGITSNPGVNNPNLEEAIVAQGPGIRLTIENPRKMTLRRATSAVCAVDGAKVYVKNPGLVGAQLLGSSAKAKLMNSRAADVTAFTTGLEVNHAGYLVSDGGSIYAPVPTEVPFTTTASRDAGQWYEVTDDQGPGSLVWSNAPRVASDGVTDDFSAFEGLAEIEGLTGKVGAVFENRRLVESLVDGSSTAGLSKNPGGSALAVTTTAGEFASGTGAIEVDTAATSTPANVSGSFTVTEDMVGRTYQIVSVGAYKQQGGTFGSAGSVRSFIDVVDGTGSAFPTSGASGTTDIEDAPGDGNMTAFYRWAHTFRVLSAGTLTWRVRYDTNNVSRDDHFHLDRVDLFEVLSDDAGFSV
ncbi:hypothetical protein FHY55_19505 [Oceanicola sp. D3]|uniref:hypothetical protein n=1 Tax=Oceanicola sp. D3 TaxID=2587163 RepID=UPI00111DA7B4|nr:hypothetical protein [Oceanicola sp. D3]QDC11285.1 hypothetical protein FHY55_19505 [Oceanicola sp. D3]